MEDGEFFYFKDVNLCRERLVARSMYYNKGDQRMMFQVNERVTIMVCGRFSQHSHV